VRTAQAIFDATIGLGLRCGIGIATGRAFCGPVGNRRRRDYDINGDAVPLAARLMRAAGGNSILCDESTFMASRDRIVFEELPRFRVKGLAQPVTVYRPLSDRTNSAAPVRCERSSERAFLIRRVQDLRSGRGGAVVIEGEPGIGKSHLVRALVADAVTNQIRCVVGSADDAERDTPYYAWRSVYADLCGLAPHAGHVNAVTDVLARSTADPTMRSLAPLLNAVIATNVPDNELTSQMVGQVRAENTVKC